MMKFILNRQHKRFTVSKIMALSLTTGLLVTGCVTPEDADSALIPTSLLLIIVSLYRSVMLLRLTKNKSCVLCNMTQYVSDTKHLMVESAIRRQATPVQRVPQQLL